MRLATFNLPTLDNSGADLRDVHAALQSTIVDTFGGFTKSIATGGWRDPASGAVYVEPVAVYHIAADWTAEERNKLESLALFYGHLAGQIAVMIIHAAGDVHFIDCVAKVTA